MATGWARTRCWSALVCIICAGRRVQRGELPWRTTCGAQDPLDCGSPASTAPLGGDDGGLRSCHRAAAGRRRAGRHFPPDRRALSGARRARRRRTRARSRHADARARSRAGAGALRRPCTGRRSLRCLAARPARELAPDREPCPRRCRAHHRRGRRSSRVARARHALGGSDRARGHRRATGRRGGHRGAAASSGRRTGCS